MPGPADGREYSTKYVSQAQSAANTSTEAEGSNPPGCLHDTIHLKQQTNNYN